MLYAPLSGAGVRGNGAGASPLLSPEDRRILVRGLVQPLRCGYSRLRSGIALGVDLDSEREIASQSGGR